MHVYVFAHRNHTCWRLSRRWQSKKDEVTKSCHLETAEYLETRNKLFGRGILSHDIIRSSGSSVLESMRQGFDHFEQNLKVMQVCISSLSKHYSYLLDYSEVKLRIPFLTWQVCAAVIYTYTMKLVLI